MEKYPGILLIAGTGRNSGKTSLALKIIERFRSHADLSAVKISPHFHKGTPGLVPVMTGGHFNIYVETGTSGSKDSTRMKNAGASTVYYMEVLDLHLEEGFEALTSLLSPSAPVIIESPALGNIMVPGVYFIVDHPKTINKKSDVLAKKPMADKFINSFEEDLDVLADRVSYDRNGWHFHSPGSEE